MRPNPPRKVIVFGVTAAESLKLLGNLPPKMIRAGWDVLVVCGSESAMHDPWDGDVPIQEIPMARDPAIFSDIRCFWQWLRVLWKVRPTVVSVGTPKASLLGLMASAILIVPHRVYMLRGLRLETTRGLPRFLLAQAEKLSAQLATRILAVSPSLKKLYIDLKLVGKTPIEVLGKGSSHGVNLRRYKPRTTEETNSLRRKIGLEVGVPVIGFVGRFRRDKGVEEVLKTAQYLHAQNIPFQILLVGPIEDSGTIIDQFVGIGQNLVSVGPVRDTATFYSAIDVLMLPTAREGFPNVALEAGASGVPVVTTDATGAMDSVVNGKTGIIAKLNSSVEFSRGVELLLTDTKLRKELGDGALKWVGANFDETIVERRYYDFYSLLVLQ